MVSINLPLQSLKADAEYNNQTSPRNNVFGGSPRPYVRAAGFFAAWSRIVVKTLLGTCAKVNGSME